MKYIIMLVMVTVLLPGIGASINLGIFYLSLFRIALCVLIGAYIYKYFKQREIYFRLKKNNAFPILFMIVWLAYSLVTVFWVKNLPLWIHGEYFLGIAVVATIGFSMAELESKDFYDILKAIQGAIAIHNLIGWYEVITHNYMFTTEERIRIMQSSKQYFPVSMMINQNDFMLVLILGICLSLFFVITSKQIKWKIANGFLVISNILLCILTDSRVGYVAMALLFVVAFFLVVPRNVRKAGVITGMVMLGILFLFGALYVANNTEQIFNIGKGIKANPMVDSDAVRVNLIKNGFVFLKETFGFGVGTGNAEYWMENAPAFYTRGFYNVHNWWIEILTNFGIIIFIGYICFFGYLIVALYKRYKNAKATDKNICIMFLCFLCAFIPASISSSSNWPKEWLWMVFAFIVAYLGTEMESKEIIKVK